MKNGLYLRLEVVRGGWRTVSEDSQEGGLLALVHLLGDRRDLRDAVELEVTSAPHQPQDLAKTHQILGLRGAQGHLVEEREDPLLDVSSPANAPPKDILSMVVATSVPVDRAAAEKRLKQLERRNAPLALRDDEFGSNLPTQLHHGASIDVHAEAAFAVDEPSDPAFQPEPFLLIICTRHVVTILPAEADGMSSAGYSDVPAYGQLHPPHRCDGGQRLSMSP
jgi:hypothetical protein